MDRRLCSCSSSHCNFVNLLVFTRKRERESEKREKEAAERGDDSLELQRQQNRFAALVELFKLLNDNAHRNARRRIINLYGENDEANQWTILLRMNATQGKGHIDKDYLHSIITESKEIVKGDFDQTGSLIKNDLVKEREFLNVYWLEVLKCWKVLEEDIKEKRKKEGNHYMENFELLKIKAEEYLRSEGIGMESPVVLDTDTFQTKFRDI